MYSFYGGPNGQSFTITKIFSSKNGSSDSLVYDLSLMWSSLITVGSFVVVSYGKPDDSNYEMYKNIDLQAEGKVYNGTFWRKEYYENREDEDGGYRVRGTGGMSYRLIASLTGNTPRLQTGTTILDANGTPSVVVDNDDPDLPHLQFYLPQAQLFLDDNVTSQYIDANEFPYIEVDCESNSERVNHPTLKFFLPQSQYIESAEIEGYLNVNENPEVRLDSDGDNGINRPVLKFKLPVAQRFISDNVVTNKIDANKDPKVSMSGNINEPTLTFDLPQAQVMAQPGADTIGPAEEPDVSLDDSNINSPKLQFKLPRAVKFLYGNKLGKKADTLLTEETVAIGDYYINEETGFVYIVEQVQESGDATVRYVACLERPLPQVNATGIDPFDARGVPVEPSVSRQFLDEDQTQWQLQFSLPKAPQIDADCTIVPSTQEGRVNVYKGTTTVTLDFSIPAGTRMFSGSGSPSDVPEAKDGDFYFDMVTGFVYQFDGQSWQQQAGKLQGPTGETLNIVANYSIQETEELKDSLIEGVNYIKANYKDTITSQKIFAITWTSVEARDTAYWYFLPEGKNSDVPTDWGRVQLTGGTDNLIEKQYNDETDGDIENKAYSVHYVNTLISETDGTTEELKRTTYPKSWIKNSIDALQESIQQNLLSWGEISDIPE